MGGLSEWKSLPGRAEVSALIGVQGTCKIHPALS